MPLDVHQRTQLRKTHLCAENVSKHCAMGVYESVNETHRNPYRKRLRDTRTFSRSQHTLKSWPGVSAYFRRTSTPCMPIQYLSASASQGHCPFLCALPL